MEKFRTGTRPLLILMTLIGLAFTLQACGGDVVDGEKAAIAVKYDVQTATGVEVEEVICPEDIAVRVGNRFACHVTTADGRRALAELRVLSGSADLRLIELVPN